MRRNDVAQMCRAELKIHYAIQMVEEMGTHPHLTDAVVKLGDARASVADFIEQVPRKLDQRDEVKGPQ